MKSSDLPARVAVTGGAGFIGSHTVELLVDGGATVLVIDDFSHACGVELPARVEVVQAEIASTAAAAALERFRPDAVVHLATKGGVVRSLRDPAEHMRGSLVSSVALFNAAFAAGARRVVAASSGGTVYGVTERLPAAEDLAPVPISPYGASKASEELYLRSLGTLHGAGILSLRYGNVYGPRQDGTGEAGLVAITCLKLLEGQPPVIFGDGLQTRDFVCVEDVARANLAALASERSGAVNIGTGLETSVKEIVERLQAEANKLIEPELRPARPAEVRRVALDNRRAQEWLGWRPKVTVAEGLRRTFAYFQDRTSTLSAAGG